MVKNFLRIEAADCPDNLFKGEKDIVVVNLNNVIDFQHKEYKGNEWYSIGCVGKKHFYVTVAEAERIFNKLGVELQLI